MLCAEVYNLRGPHMRCFQSPEHFCHNGYAGYIHCTVPRRLVSYSSSERHALSHCWEGQEAGCFAGPFTWNTGAGAGGQNNTQAWEALTRMWGVNPNSQRWRDMMRDFERSQTVFNQVSAHRALFWAAFTKAVLFSACIYLG